MTAAFRLLAVSAAATFAAGTAWAELTAAQVWADWQQSAADFGQILTAGSEEAGDGRLTLRDVTIAMDAPDGGVSGTIAEIVMTEQGDGSVAIEMSPEFPMDITMSPPEGEQGSLTMVIDQSQLDLVASGAPDAISYAYSAPTVGVTLGQAMADGQPLEMQADLTIAGLSGSYTVTPGEVREVVSDLSAETVTLALSGSDSEGTGDTFQMNLSVAGITSQSTGTMSAVFGMTNLSEMVANGFTSSGTTTHGPMDYTLSGTSEGSAFSMAGTTAEGSYDATIGADGFVYGGSSKGVSVTLTSSDIPFPDMTFGMEEAAGRFAMPIGVSEEPQDVGLAIRLVGLTVSDTLWNMFDPSSALPRDPATLILDVAGKANWLVDVFDPAMAEEEMEMIPGQVHEVDVNELRLSLAGAELTGSGAFDVNNDAPIPQPSGTMNFQLVGGNTLIDKLVQMGLVPEDQAMGARMMLGLFARPGEGEDTLVSEIVVQPDGAILANGQRIR